MKPLKDTKLGQWLKEKAPKVLGIVGDILPDKGILGIVKNLINNDPEIPAEQKLEFEKLHMDFEKEMMDLEIQDRASARSREVEFIKASGHMDYMMWFLAVAGIGIFGFIVYHLVKDNIPIENRELITNIIGLIEGVLLSMYSYYWGSSAGSRIKDMKGK